ncbi:hypothetical protein [Halorientalis salina]|uniref:hypothetical protein n=1 Tax=Halorientalis salina TaxID=2932266 RepID=UPI0010AC9A36|nr:hypothetical protein [Halorientalis salina]
MCPRRQRTVGIALAVALLGVVMLATPVTASATDATFTSSGQSTDDGINRTLDGTVVVTATGTDDCGLLLGGTSGFERGNATLTKLAADGSTAWTRHYNTSNRTGIVAVERGPDDGIYALQYASNFSQPGSGSYSMWLVRTTDAGEISWRRSVNASGLVGGRDTLAVSETGPALAVTDATGRNASLLQFGADGDLRWNRTYGVDASPGRLETTDDGYLLTGIVGFDHPWILRTDDEGRIVDNRTYDRIDVQNLVGSRPTEDGIVLAGTYAADFGSGQPWVASVGTDGVPRWSRVYPGSNSVRVQSAFPDGDGITLVGSSQTGTTTDSSGYLVGVGANGSERYTESIPGLIQTVAVPGPNRTVTVAGMTGYPGRNVTSVVRTVALPDASPSHDRGAVEPITSSRTHYRGQQLSVVRPKAAGETLELVAVPGEYDDFESRVVRRLELDADGRAVVDSTTLSRGTYYLRTTDGEPLDVTSGWALAETDRDSATFEVASQDLYTRDSDGTYVDRADGESTAAITVDSERSDYALYVSADRFRGGQVDAETLRGMFPNESVSIERVRGTPVARLPADGQENVTIDVASVEAGLYDVSIRGTDTGHAGASMEHRLVVGSETSRPLSVSLRNETLAVPVGGDAATNVTVENATDGIAAMSMSANRSGPPAVQLSVDLNINGTSAQASSGWSDHESDADAQAFGGNTANGTVVVGSLSVSADNSTLDPESDATNTVSFRLDWVVDENGVPYTVPEGTTVTVEVEDIENATGEFHERSGHRPRPRAERVSGSS